MPTLARGFQSRSVQPQTPNDAKNQTGSPGFLPFEEVTASSFERNTNKEPHGLALRKKTEVLDLRNNGEMRQSPHLSAPQAIGIDFGTTNSSVALASSGQVNLVRFPRRGGETESF